jgi:hypothetical protein
MLDGCCGAGWTNAESTIIMSCQSCKTNEEKGTEREFLELLDQELASKDISHSDRVGNVCESHQSKMKAMPFWPNHIGSCWGKLTPTEQVTSTRKVNDASHHRKIVWNHESTQANKKARKNYDMICFKSSGRFHSNIPM